MLRSVFIQTKTTCNAKCTICPHSTSYKGKEKSMEWWLLELILRKLPNDFSGELGFYFQYEPLTDSRLPDVLSLAKSIHPRATTAISTNASLLNASWGAALIDGGCLSKVYFNIIGGTARTYEKMMPPLKWDQVMSNIWAFASVFKGQMFVNYPKTKETADEVESLRKRLPSDVSLVSDYWASNRGGSCAVNTPEGSRTRFDVKGGVCDPIKKCLYVYHDGIVPLCCQCWNREVILGDLKTDSLSSILSHPERRCNHPICEICK